MRIKITVAYDGSGFHGFQRQNNLITVQGKLENAIEKIFEERVTVTASGRTDAGVHAYGQVVHFDVQKQIVTEKIKSGLNFFLPETIRVTDACVVSDNFNARIDAKQKTYFYDMYIDKTDFPLLLNKAHRIKTNIDIVKMKSAAKLFIGTKNFAAFHCSGSESKNFVRTVSECEITETEIYGKKALRLKITANGFLYKMVRLITDAIIKAGEGKISVMQIEKLLLDEKKRTNKYSVPACGLYLYKVEY